MRGGPRIVFGDGPVPADIMLLGGHPTENDEALGTPFTGVEGELLIELLNKAEIGPESCYRCHLVACRPKVLLPKTEEEEERIETVRPKKEDFEGIYESTKKNAKLLREGCKDRLLAQIYEVDPRVIVTFGEDPLKMLKARTNMGKLSGKMSEAQGDLFEVQIPGKVSDAPLRYPVIAALDMGYLIRNPVTERHGPIYIVAQALQRARQYIEWVQRCENGEEYENPHGPDGS
jgi:DNA polymerase